ncbi:SRPBCC family protein [Chamaesiphon sp.]|uniref:SRPBCC family protein n=1 Tax=Chamaesiphon sp. TaxID=2814140 RepID=UPI00359441A6
MKFSHTLQTSASPEKIWAIWTDVAHWSEWDTELSAASLDGTFGLGAVGKLRPKSGPVSSFRISQFNVGKSYTFTTKLPLSQLNVYRHLHIGSDGTYFTHEVSFQGFLAFLFGVLLGRRFRTKLPGIMENIKRIAEVQR